MSQVRNQLVKMIGYLPDQGQLLLFEIVKRFVPDDVATSDSLKDVHTARVFVPDNCIQNPERKCYYEL